MVVFGQRLLYLGKRDCIRATWFYSGKVVVFGQKLLYCGKLVVFGQVSCILTKWFYSWKSGCIRAE